MTKQMSLLDLPDRKTQQLYDFAQELPVIDAHEHFKPEKWAMELSIDFSYLFSYCLKYMPIAGNPDVREGFEGTDRSPQEKWRLMKPSWPLVRHTSYGKGVRLSAQALIGEDDVTDRNYMKITQLLAHNNRPGIYRRYCRENHIAGIIASNGTRDTEPHPYSPADLEHMGLIIGVISPASRDALLYYGLKSSMRIRDGATLLDALDDFVARQLRDPAVIGWKTCACYLSPVNDPKAADAAVRQLLKGQPIAQEQQMALNRFFYDHLFDVLGKHKLPVAVHCGVSADYRDKDVKNFIPMFQRFPLVHFDLFHMSLPSHVDFAWCGRNFANVSLNFCWAHLVSQELFERGAEACLDVVPINKIIAFGGDFGFCPPAAVGGLTMAKESLARVLGRKVNSGRMGMTDARHIMRLWLYGNPKAIYRL